MCVNTEVSIFRIGGMRVTKTDGVNNNKSMFQDDIHHRQIYVEMLCEHSCNGFFSSVQILEEMFDFA